MTTLDQPAPTIELHLPATATVTADLRPALPRERGPLSSRLLARLRGADVELLPAGDPVGSGDPIVDDDLQLCLHVIHELSRRGYRWVDADEGDDQVLALRNRLEARFEQHLRSIVDTLGLARDARQVSHVITRLHGPSLSGHIERRGTAEQLRELAIHRTVHHLDRAGSFADVLEALGVDPSSDAHVDRLPAVTLAIGNLAAMLGLRGHGRSALLGHLAAAETTSVRPMTACLLAAIRLGLDARAQRSFEVEAERHRLAAAALAEAERADGIDTAELASGAAAQLVVEDRFARHLLHAWAHDRSSLRPVTAPAPSSPVSAAAQ